MFKLKKWLWTKYSALMGVDRAYAKYLAHFEHYQTQVVDGALQTELNVSPMSKEAFMKVWKSKVTLSSGKKGCCG